METKFAPICLFVYKRSTEIKKTIEALQQNFSAAESELYIFSDGWKSEADREVIIAIRGFLKQVTGFKQITIVESDSNKGLSNSIISGVTNIIEKYGKVIVVEDDLVTSPNFLNFMNQGLDHYKGNDNIYSISGYTLDLPSLKFESKDFYLGYRSSSWGWATWLERWSEIDWEVKDYSTFVKSTALKRKFRRGGNDLPRMLRHQMTGKIDSWAIRWCYQQFKNNQLTVFPSKTKVECIGFGRTATHTNKRNIFDSVLEVSNQEKFTFDVEIELNKKLIKEYRFVYSLIMKIVNRLWF